MSPNKTAGETTGDSGTGIMHFVIIDTLSGTKTPRSHQASYICGVIVQARLIHVTITIWRMPNAWLLPGNLGVAQVIPADHDSSFQVVPRDNLVPYPLINKA